MAKRLKITVLAAAVLGGCTTMPPVAVHQPMTARPVPAAEAPGGNGSIYQAGYTNRSLFEDRRARNVGDTLIITINEKISASKKSSTTADRKGSSSMDVPLLGGLSAANILKTPISGSSDSTFEGKGDSSANNAFTGTIAVTVIEVLPNGNLIVAGEKQIALDKGTEYIRLSGVVQPDTIQAGNTVSSTKVADARLEYRTSAKFDSAEVMGWLGRFFLSFIPL